MQVQGVPDGEMLCIRAIRVLLGGHRWSQVVNLDGFEVASTWFGVIILPGAVNETGAWFRVG